MEFHFQYNLSDVEKTKLASWYNVQNNVTIEQHPFWPEVVANNNGACFFYATVNDQIVCSAIIEETIRLKMKIAEISFGPLFNDKDIALSCLDQIYSYYKSKGFTRLTVQLGINVDSESEYIEYKLSKIRPFRSRFDQSNWSSIIIDLQKTEEELLRNMSKGHKSDIKKAQKEGLTVIQDFTEQQFTDFIKVYEKMHYERGLAENNQGSLVFLNKVRNHFQTFGTGALFLVLDKEKTVIGGIAVAHQHKTARYFKGAANPEIKGLPVLHLAIWEAIKVYKKKEFNWFDLWGYNHFVTETDQVFFINRFKKGFGGAFIFYPKRMYYVFKPLQHALLIYAKTAYQKIKKNVRIRRHNKQR